MKPVYRLSIIVAWCLMSAFQPVVGQTGEAELEPLPELKLDEVSEPVREALTEARSRVEQKIEQDVSDAALAEAYGQFADISFAHAMIRHARIGYHNAIKLRPNRQEWHYLLGLVEISEGNLEAGIASLDRALEIYPADHAALIHRGRALLEKGEPKRAELDFTMVHEAASNTPAALSGLGRAALQRENYEEAVKWLEEALAVSPEANRLHYLLGNAYRALGETEKAREHLARGGDREVPMRDPVLDQIRRMSRSSQFFVEAGLDQAEAGNFEGAEQMMARARELAPENTSILRDHGELLARLGRLDEARDAFERLASLEPDSVEARLYLGQIEEMRENYSGALEVYRTVLELEPGNERAERAMAHVFLAQGETERAIEAFERLSGQADDIETTARFRYWRGIAELAGGDCGGATETLEAVRELTDKPNASVLEALARIRATCGQAEGEKLEQALEWAKMVYDADPGVETSATLAMVHAAAGNFDDAVDYQAQAMFEAHRDGLLEQRPDLRNNMNRYQEGKAAESPFSPGDPTLSGGIAR